MIDSYCSHLSRLTTNLGLISLLSEQAKALDLTKSELPKLRLLFAHLESLPVYDVSSRQHESVLNPQLDRLFRDILACLSAMRKDLLELVMVYQEETVFLSYQRLMTCEQDLEKLDVFISLEQAVVNQPFFDLNKKVADELAKVGQELKEIGQDLGLDV